MNQEQARQKLNQIIELTSIQFEKSITTLVNSPFIIKLFCQVLSSNRKDSTLQLAAVGINYTVKRRLSQNYIQYQWLWQQIRIHLLEDNHINDIKWKDVIIISKTIQMLLNQFQENQALCPKINSLFKSLPYKAKALLFQSFLYAETALQTKCIFFRQNIHDFLLDTLNFISNYHMTNKFIEDYSKLQKSVLKIIFQILKNMYANIRFIPMQQLYEKICTNNTLFTIILQQLLFDLNIPNYVSLNNSQYHIDIIKEPEIIKEVILQSRSQYWQQLNNNKAITINILSYCIAAYDQKCALEQFNFYQYLFMMENIMPLIIDKLIYFSSNIQQHIQKSELIIKMLQFVNRSVKYNFLLQFYQQKISQIYYMICVPLLACTKDELEDFQQDSDEFINISRNLFDKVGQQKEQTLKNIAGELLQALCFTIHGSLLFVVQDCILCIRKIILGEDHNQIRQAIQLYKYRPSIQCCFTVLTLLANQFQARQDIIDLIKEQLMSIDEIFSISTFQKARFHIFISYTYSCFYLKNPAQGQKFIISAQRQLHADNCSSKCAVMLLQNCIQQGVQSIWFILSSKIQDTQNIQIFILLKKTIKQNLCNIMPEQINKIIDIIISRLVNQYSICKNSSKEGKVIGNQYVYKCLDILQQIVQCHYYVKKHQFLIHTIWNVFDLFQFVQEIQFQDNILRIFNQIISALDFVDQRHLKFTKYFYKICQKQEKLGELKSTYGMLLVKGRQYYLTQPQGQNALQELLSIIQQSYGINHYQQTLKYILSIQYYALYQYHSVLKRDQRFQTILLDIYNRLKGYRQYLGQESIAGIINYFVISGVQNGSKYAELIKENDICIFKGFQGKLFAHGLRKLIENYYDSNEVLDYLRCAIRLLHFIKTVAHQSYKQECHDIIQLQFSKIDPFHQICQALQFLKRSIDHKIYDNYLQELSNEISLGEIKDLLSQRLIDRSLRVYKKIKEQI